MYKADTAGVKVASKSELPPAYKRIEDNLASHFGTRVKLKPSRNGSGQITIEYYSLDELNSILRKIDIRVD